LPPGEKMMRNEREKLYSELEDELSPKPATNEK
jgi:hypothetical protein